jgi:hypothetical protein
MIEQTYKMIKMLAMAFIISVKKHVILFILFYLSLFKYKSYQKKIIFLDQAQPRVVHVQVQDRIGKFGHDAVIRAQIA